MRDKIHGRVLRLETTWSFLTKYGAIGAVLGSLIGLAIRNLAIGKSAPDIEGDDLDGKKFKLSEYRGKVVVLDFWGNW